MAVLFPTWLSDRLALPVLVTLSVTHLLAPHALYLHLFHCRIVAIPLVAANYIHSERQHTTQNFQWNTNSPHIVLFSSVQHANSPIL
jgi:hypothetical protein